MEQKAPLFRGSVDGVQFDDYRAFTKFLHEHPESARIEFSLDSSAVKEPSPFTTTCHVIEKGQALNPNEILYPLLETPDHYLANHDQSSWLGDLDKVVTYVNSFLEKHKENIKTLSIDQLEEHTKVLNKCSADVVEAFKFNEEADKSVRNSTTEYSTELDKLNECIKKCKQRINAIRREEMPTLENKKHALAVVGKLLCIYEETYARLINQTAQELKYRKGEGLNGPSNRTKASHASDNGMIRLLNAIFGSNPRE